MLDIQPVDAHAAHGAAHAGSHVMAKSAVTPLFRNRYFLRLWFVAAATQVGGHMALFAMTILVFSTTRSNTAVSALLMTYMLPQVLLSPFAGVIIDRVDLRWAMIAPNAVRAALMVGLALAASASRSCCSSMSGSASRASRSCRPRDRWFPGLCRPTISRWLWASST